jgi:hypothetical protein
MSTPAPEPELLRRRHHGGAIVTLRRHLEIDGDLGVGGDEATRREGDVAGVVVDHIILILSSLQAHSIGVHTFGAGDDHITGGASLGEQRIRTLQAGRAPELEASEFALGLRARRRDAAAPIPHRARDAAQLPRQR